MSSRKISIDHAPIKKKVLTEFEEEKNRFLWDAIQTLKDEGKDFGERVNNVLDERMRLKNTIKKYPNGGSY